MVLAIVYMSAREELMEGFGDEGRGRGGEGVREEKDGTESSRRACARVPISQLEIVSKEFSTEPLTPSDKIKMGVTHSLDAEDSGHDECHGSLGRCVLSTKERDWI